MAAKQLKCKETGKMRYISRCMRKECKNLIVTIITSETWKLADPKLIKKGIGTRFMCIAD
jgi:hypothetical protein